FRLYVIERNGDFMNKRSIKIRAWWLVAAAFFIIVACEEDPILTGEEVSFTADIQPLINQNCTSSGCHGAGSVEFELITYNQVKLKAAAIRQLIWVDRATPHHTVSMSESDRQKFRDWVDDGAPNN